jgi:hypothetical protein
MSSKYQSNKITIKIKIIILILIKSIFTLFSSKNKFNIHNFKNSIYFSDIDPLSNLEFSSEIQRPHKIDQVIFKLTHTSQKENLIQKFKNNKKNFEDKINSIKSRSFLNIKISKKLYEVNICIDEMDALNKNQLLKYFNNQNFNQNLNLNNKKINDIYHTDLINILRKKDFTEIDPKKYNDEKIEKRYNNNNNNNNIYFNKKNNKGKLNNNDINKKDEFGNLINDNYFDNDIDNDNDNDNENYEDNPFNFYENFEIEYEKCFRKFEFLNEDNPRYNMPKSEEFNLIKIINETLIKQNLDEEYSHIFNEFIDIELGDTILKLKKYVNDYIKWEDDNIIIEFNFDFNNINLLNLYNNNIINNKDLTQGDNKENSSNNNNNKNENFNKFILTKIFIYFLQTPKLELETDYINKINLNYASFKSFKANKKSEKNKKNSNNNNNNPINDQALNINNNRNYYISLIQTYQNFENIFIDYKILNKKIKYTKDFYGKKNPKISIKQISHKNKTSSLIKNFYTLQRESIFHNKLTCLIDLNIYKKEILETNSNNKICILIYFHLTEDIYIEKNELKLHLQNTHKNFEQFFFFSEEIDQEISSDISKQYFISFSFCGKKDLFNSEIFKNNIDVYNFKIEIPVHFRYQPPLYHISHQEVFLNLPLIDLVIQESQNFNLEKVLINRGFFKMENFSLKKFDEKKEKIKFKDILRFYFSKEINERLKWLNEINLIFENLDEIRHFIPVAQMQDFYFVMFGTFISAFIGFFIVLFGVINYKIKEKID